MECEAEERQMGSSARSAREHPSKYVATRPRVFSFLYILVEIIPGHLVDHNRGGRESRIVHGSVMGGQMVVSVGPGKGLALQETILLALLTARTGRGGAVGGGGLLLLRLLLLRRRGSQLLRLREALGGCGCATLPLFGHALVQRSQLRARALNLRLGHKGSENAVEHRDRVHSSEITLRSRVRGVLRAPDGLFGTHCGA